jgi:hypothetical protein
MPLTLNQKNVNNGLFYTSTFPLQCPRANAVPPVCFTSPTGAERQNRHFPDDAVILTCHKDVLRASPTSKSTSVSLTAGFKREK